MKNLLCVLLLLLPSTLFGATLEEVNTRLSFVDAEISEIFSLCSSFDTEFDDVTDAIDVLLDRNIPFNDTAVANDLGAAATLVGDIFDQGVILDDQLDVALDKFFSAGVYKDLADYSTAMTRLDEAEAAILAARAAYYTSYNTINTGSAMYGAPSVSYANSIQFRLDHADTLLDALEQ
jgi:hypothetical protein